MFGIARPNRFLLQNAVEDLAADADITARAFARLPTVGRVLSVWVTFRAASAGVDASNAATITLRNITKGVDIATVTLTANVAANAAVELVITTANASFSRGDVLGIVVTQGTTANLPAFDLTVDCDAEQL
jgi:hypothetical protein